MPSAGLPKGQCQRGETAGGWSTRHNPQVQLRSSGEKFKCSWTLSSAEEVGFWFSPGAGLGSLLLKWPVFSSSLGCFKAG